MRRTKEEAEQTRLQILSAAIKVMNQKGIGSTRFEDIAKEANVTRGAIYYYYKNKSEILYAIHEENKKHVHGIMDKYLIDDVDPIIGMKKGLFEIFTKFENDAKFRAVEELFLKVEFASIMKENVELSNLFEKDREESICKMLSILKKGQESGSIRKDIELEKLSFALMAFYLGLTSLSLIRFREFSIAEMANDYIDILLHGILK